MPRWLTLPKAALKSFWTITASCPLSNTLCSVWDMHKGASQVPRPFRWANCVVGSTPLRSINRPRRTDTRRSNTLDNTDVIEIGRQLATEEDGGPFGIGVTLACLHQAGKLPRRTSCQKMGNYNISSSLKKKRKHIQWVSATIRVKSNKRRLSSLDLNAKVVRLGDGWQVSSRSTASLDWLLSKWSNSRSALPTDSHH